MKFSILLHLGKLKGLSALNLDGNPLDHPPMEVVKHGIKAIQQYLRDEQIRHRNSDATTLESEEESSEEEPNIDLVGDVWASSDDETDGQRRLTRSQHRNVLSRPPLLLPLQKSKYFSRK